MLKRREAGIWQRRFWEHHIRDEADYIVPGSIADEMGLVAKSFQAS